MTAKRTLPVIFIFACCLLAFCADSAASARTAGADTAFTAEYRAFLAAHKTDLSEVTRADAGGRRYTLKDGRLCIIGTEGAEIWRSNEEWYVDSFRLCDVNRDLITDIAFVVWKSYSFGTEHPARMTNEDAAVRCHLFVYSIKDDRVKPLWCSSNLPRPIYEFTLDTDGEQTPVLSGVRLVTREGTYTEDYGETASAEYIYAWSSPGFSPL
jgi:hypothetical protein